MKSFKTELLLIILLLLSLSTVVASSIGILQSHQTTDKITRGLINDRLISSSNMLEVYLYEQFGAFRLNSNNELVDKYSTSIKGKLTYLDKFAESMDVLATIFVKEGTEFRRVMTTVSDEDGKRAVDTFLDAESDAYKQIIKGEQYYGTLSLFGDNYVTLYRPILDSTRTQVIGIYFVGMPIDEIEDTLTTGLNTTILSVATVVLIVLIIAGVVTYVISRRLADPIIKITSVAEEISNGNFDISLDIKSRNEVGRLANSFNSTIHKLNNYKDYIAEVSQALETIASGNLNIILEKEYTGEFAKLKVGIYDLTQNISQTLLEIKQSADQVFSGADQIANGSQILSQGATEQASSIEELSVAIHSVSTQIEKTATNAVLAKSRAEAAGGEIETTHKHMTSMIEAMDNINKMASEISKIIKVIDDIAFQTNILALNASVEAARAGEAGKGFVVVANEVRNLAGKSAEAAKNTTSLIENANKAVKGGTYILEQTAESLDRIEKTALDAIVLIEEIALACNDESVAINQISQGVEQISTVTQHNAATSEESAAASEELAGQSENLRQLIGRFTIKKL